MDSLTELVEMALSQDGIVLGVSIMIHDRDTVLNIAGSALKL